MKILETGGITYLELLGDGTDWYCGTDYASGDLYEAEEVFLKGLQFRPNRLIFVHHPEGTLYEPVPSREGQYFGRPALIDGIIYILLVDFPAGLIRILDCGPDLAEVKLLAELSLDSVKDCYNLLLHGKPLMLTRQGGDNRLELIWPQQASIPVGERESFAYREKDRMYFLEWFEDPQYREEVVVRSYPSGEEVDRWAGSLFIPPCGESWILR